MPTEFFIETLAPNLAGVGAVITDLAGTELVARTAATEVTDYVQKVSVTLPSGTTDGYVRWDDGTELIAAPERFTVTGDAGGLTSEQATQLETVHTVVTATTTTGPVLIIPDPSDDATQTTCYTYARDHGGNRIGGQTLLFRLSTLPTTDGNAYGPLISAVSSDDADTLGLVTVELKRNTDYKMRIASTWQTVSVASESGYEVTFTTPDSAGPFELPEIWAQI